ncbi:MAG TPA: hypothetical protein VGM88_18475 [Kofleriaceae bacterium]|jgi:YVTN family beta-propeller protein
MKRALLAAALAACSSSHPGGPGDGAPAGDAPAADAGGGAALAFSPTFTFESGPVRPLAMSADGAELYVANTSNASLDILSIDTAGGLARKTSTYVGLDPVAVAVRAPGEVWVVNQISDSVSIVDTTTSPPHVARTLLVGDEPSDIVFAGDRAFITTAHRGQARTDPALAGVPGAGDPQLTTPGVGRADVWVFDAANLSASGAPVAILTLFGDTPRGLAVTPDGATVYAAIFKSGNQSTATSSELPCATVGSTTPCTVAGQSIPGGAPGPATNHAGVAAPQVAVLLHADAAGAWRDVLGRDWSALTKFSLPDEDVFAIDATSLATTAAFQHVGTTLFALAVNPANGHVYVSNTDARNDLRFEGPGTFAGTTLQGHLAESRVTVIAGSTVTPHRLNPHIDYAQLPAPAGTADHSLATPLGMAVSGDGQTIYIAAFGSSKIGVLPTAALESDTFDPTSASANYLAVSGGGPSGLVLDEARGKLYVATRFDDGVSAIDLATKTESAHVLLTNPEPTAVTQGRPFLYDALHGSSNGEASCASCHPFGDDDHLAWDLGNPDADATDVPSGVTIKLGVGAPATINGTGSTTELDALKGPMTTQTLRGLVNHGPMHWRGDRVSGYFGSDPSTGAPYDSNLAFKNFIVAFPGLVGRADQIADADMQTFSDFALAIAMPPNAVRALDNSLTTSQAAGRSYFLGCAGTDSIHNTPVQCDAAGNLMPGFTGHFSDGVSIANLGFACNGCHVLDAAQGFFGTDGGSSFEALPQTMKVPQLRDLYEKVGMFGNAALPNTTAGNNGAQGPQIRGAGFEHDGSVDTIFRFLSANVFASAQGGRVGFAGGDAQRRDVEQWLLAFDGDLAPIVGQQVTLRADNAAVAGPRIDLLLARAAAPFTSKLLGAGATECTLVATMAGTAYVYDGSAFQPGAVSDATLRARATAGHEITYTCLPPGWAH